MRQAVRQHLMVDGPRGRMFAWSGDLRGKHRFYDSPPGSLQLLGWLGFCPPDDPALKATIAWLHSPQFPYSFAGEPCAELGCAHSTQPWTLSLANSLLCGRKAEARPLLEKLEMDGGLACEAFDAKTGKPYSGEAFATAAGFLAFAIHHAFGQPFGSAGQRPAGFAQGGLSQKQGVARRPVSAPRAGGLGASISFPKPAPSAQPAPAPVQAPSKPVGAVTLKGGKRSTKGVEALVKPEPLRPPKKAAPKKAAPKKKPAPKPVKKKR